MDISTIILLLGAVGGLAGLITAVSTVIFKIIELRKESKGQGIDAKLAPIIKTLEEQDEALRLIRLDTTRLQLLSLIRNDPHNHDTILMVAERYFLVLKGDWIASAEFLSWAEKEHVKVSSAIVTAIEHNHVKK